MQTFILRFPIANRLRLTGYLYLFLTIIAIVVFFWSLKEFNKYTTYFSIALFFIAQAILIAIQDYKKFFSVEKTVVLFYDKIIIEDKEPTTFLFSDLNTCLYGASNISITVTTGKIRTFRYSQMWQKDRSFIDAFKLQMDQWISSGTFPMTRKMYWPFIESKWVKVVILCYVVALFSYHIYLHCFFSPVPHAFWINYLIMIIVFGIYIGLWINNKDLYYFKRNS